MTDTPPAPEKTANPPLSTEAPPTDMKVPEKEPGPRTYLAVPYEARNQAKKLGAKWDRHRKSWYAPEGADLARLDGWRLKERVPSPTRDIDPTTEFTQALEKEGLVLKGTPLMDGKWHRVPVIGDKKGAKSGSYRGFLDGKPNGSIMNYKNGQEAVKWISTGTALAPQELERLKVEANARQAAREAEREVLAKEAAELARNLWHDRDTIKDQIQHPYLEKKGIRASVNVGQKDGHLLIPLQDVNGNIQNIQSIDADGHKRYLEGGRKQGLMHWMDPDRPPLLKNTFLIVEGYATGKSLQDATALPLVVAFDGGNLRAVAEAIRKAHPEATLVLAGDNDHAHKKRNVGFENARDAAEAVDGFHISPCFTEAEKAQGLTDYNDLADARGEEAFRKEIDAQLTVALDPIRAKAPAEPQP
ncbi:DUF5710 domain-containing protein [Rhodospirillum sp. A1_3_36]|uniref:DUF5710 domain-containing protein n=1 Tax=Rhodospirillum sp. A1_3_36 TaxID=3391666 RepID=UPI0039A6CFF3